MTTPRFQQVWDANPELTRLLRDSATLAAARRAAFDYLNRQEQLFLNHEFDIHALELVTIIECTDVMKQVISERSETVTGHSALRILWRKARGELVEDTVAPGFKEEFRHLFHGIRGQSRLYPEMVAGPPPQLTGRAAARERSRGLDRLGERIDGWIRRYPTGLDPIVARRREHNRRRIAEQFGGSPQEWANHVWQLRHIVRDSATLGRLVKLTPEERSAIDQANDNHIPFGVTPHYVSLMDYNASRLCDHSVRAQVIPTPEYVELMQANRQLGTHSLDFMQEHDTSPVDLVTRRYPGIAILKPYNTCAQVCVYCQRNWEISRPWADDALAPADRLAAAIDWFRSHPYVREVLVTGGDPLVAGTRFIAGLLSRLADIRHIERIRIGSRVPVTLPMRFTRDLADVIARHHEPGRREVCVVTHVQHCYELTPETVAAVQQLRRRGIAVYNQMVFTRENSRRFEAVALRRLLRLAGVDPYYSFNTKGKEETVDFRVPIARLLQEQKEEARLVPGLVRTDEAVFNVPGMGKNYVRAGQHHRVIMIRPDGRRVYEFHPWEKGISLAPTYIDTDVGIWEYLEWLESVGEKPQDYRSIWYYH